MSAGLCQSRRSEERPPFGDKPEQDQQEQQQEEGQNSGFRVLHYRGRNPTCQAQWMRSLRQTLDVHGRPRRGDVAGMVSGSALEC